MKNEQLRALQREQERIREEWVEKWPDYCQHCQASGEITYEENYGIPGPTETLTDTCPKCLDKNKCPRCGEEFSDEALLLSNHSHLVCQECEWSTADPDTAPDVIYLYGDSDDERDE